MKIQTSDTNLVYDLVNHMREKGLPDKTAGYLRFLLEDNIPMHIKLNGELYISPWRYWRDYVLAHSDCCGCCDEESIKDLDNARDQIIKHSVKVQPHAIDY